MKKVLVVDDDRNVRHSLGYTLVDAGYDVIQAENGAAALELALHERPNIILLDVMMPVMDGFEVLKRLKRNPVTESIPVILLTVVDAIKGEGVGMELGVSHYLTKPWEPGDLESAVRITLREAGAINEEDMDGGGVDTPRSRTLVKTGNGRMDQALRGGIPLGSLTLIDGIQSAGKSVLCQHFAYESLIDGHAVAYSTSEYTARSLITQFESLGREVSDYVRNGKFSIYPMPGPTTDGGSERREGPDRLMSSLAAHIEGLSRQYRVIMIDAITDLAAESQEGDIVKFFSSCRHLSDNDGATIIVVARSYAFDENMLDRLQLLCDAHLSLRIETMGAKMVKMLEVRKLHNARLNTDNMIGFEVVAGTGLNILSGRKVKL